MHSAAWAPLPRWKYKREMAICQTLKNHTLLARIGLTHPHVADKLTERLLHT